MGMESRKILIVEDDAIIAAAESIILRNNGYDIITVLGGAEAIAAVRSRDGEIGLILMDIELGPGKDGTEIAREILRERRIPILFISSHSAKEIAAKTEGIPSCGYVLKEAGDAALLASIEAAFRTPGPDGHTPPPGGDGAGSLPGVGVTRRDARG